MQKLLLIILLLSFAPGPGPGRPAPKHDPPVPSTIGFFMDSWQPKTFAVPDAHKGAVPAAATTTLIIHPDSIITRIPLTEFGHNADTWMGTMVTQPALIGHLRNLNPHIIRWPAGSGSDAYFWNAAPGDLPADVPAQLMDAGGNRKPAHWFYGRTKGHFGASLDDYYDLLRLTGNEGLITVNYGYARYGAGPNPVAAAAHLAADWVRYDHGRTKYWEIGNENFGNWESGYRIDTTLNRDGQPQLLTGTLYGEHFRVFADSMRNAARETGSTIYIGAVTHEGPPQAWDPPLTKGWNEGMIRSVGDRADYYVVHNYFTPWNRNSGASEILHDALTVPSDMMGYVLKCLHESGAGVKPIAMDEWNMFAIGSKQQVSNTSGLFSILVLGEAIRNKYGLAARWDLLNGWSGGNDHGIFSAGDEPGVSRWSPRPSFYYLYYLQRMLGDRLVGSEVSGDTSLRTYASGFSSGEVGAVVVNTSTTASTLTIDIRNFKPGKHWYWYSLEGGNDNGEFSRKVSVNGDSTSAPAGGPSDYASLPAYEAAAADGIRVTVPARGAVFVVVGRR
jgi:hypothetical protein